MNQPVMSTITCPPPDTKIISPAGPMLWIPPAARVWPRESMLRIDARGRVVPVGCVVTKPAPEDSVTVTTNDSAVASGGASAGSGIVTVPPGATG